MGEWKTQLQVSSLRRSPWWLLFVCSSHRCWSWLSASREQVEKGITKRRSAGEKMNICSSDWAPPLSLFLCLRECYRFSTTGSLPLKVAPDRLTIGKSKHEMQFSPLTISEQGRDDELRWPSSSRELRMLVAASTSCLDLYRWAPRALWGI